MLKMSFGWTSLGDEWDGCIYTMLIMYYATFHSTPGTLLHHTYCDHELQFTWEGNKMVV